jgi:hypothetical protein
MELSAKRPESKPARLTLAERRRYPRWAFNLPVRELRPEQHLMRGTSVSPGGIFCPYAAPRDRGTEMTIEIDMLTHHAPITVQARVAHSGRGRGGGGIGLEFVAPPEQLMRFLATHRAPRV